MYWNNMSQVRLLCRKIIALEFAYGVLYNLFIMRSYIKKIAYITLGLLALSLGAVVRFVPGVPTTPFLLLALFCFNKSSDRLSAWLKNTYLYKKYLADYVKSRSMTIRQKITIQIIASTMMAISFITIDNLWFRIVMAVLFAVHHYVFIFRIKTQRPADYDHTHGIIKKRDQEKDMLNKMIMLYCHKNRHGSDCTGCTALLKYALSRADHCPYIASKKSCKHCQTPCYNPHMRQSIRKVMRFSGPRMLLHHPVAVLRYKVFNPKT